MVQVKERGGGGKERKETALTLSLPPLSVFGPRLICGAIKTENPLPRSLFAPKPNKTLATQANSVF